MKYLLWEIYVYKFFDGLILIYPFYIIMFGDFGQTPLQIGILLGVWSITSLLLEVPSGVLADMYNRKNILFIGQILRAVGYLLWLLYPTFLGFLLGFILWGIKSALTSGTFQALVYDELKAFGKEQHYSKIIGRTTSLRLVAMFTSSLLATFAIGFGYPIVIGLSLISLTISATAILLLKSVCPIQSTEERTYFVTLKKGFWEVRRHPFLFKIILFTSVLGGLAEALDEYLPIFATLTPLTVSLIPIFLALDSGVQAIVSYYAHYLKKVPDRQLYLSFLFASVVLALATYVLSIPALALLLLHGAVYAVLVNVFEAKIQHVTDGEARATVLSLNNFTMEIFVLFVYLGFGAISNFTTYQYGFYAFSIIGALVSVTYMVTALGKLDLRRGTS